MKAINHWGVRFFHFCFQPLSLYDFLRGNRHLTTTQPFFFKKKIAILILWGSAKDFRGEQMFSS